MRLSKNREDRCRRRRVDKIIIIIMIIIIIIIIYIIIYIITKNLYSILIKRTYVQC